MGATLSLIKNDWDKVEKRILPKFPFTYLTFKGKGDRETQKVFEVKDISFSGMQLCLKDGGHNYIPKSPIEGQLHWRGKELTIQGEVQWVRGQRMGVRFLESNGILKDIKSFLSIENIVEGIRPLHQSVMGIELPPDLKFWLRNDGPSELFVWQHSNGEFSRFHVILMKTFIEWEDGRGLVSGTVMTKRDLDTPLVEEDEFVFKIDNKLDSEKLAYAREFVHALPDEGLPPQAKNFVLLKLGSN